MSSSYHRSSSTRPSRRIQIVAPLHSHRTTSVPHRQFIIILTNNPELLRQTRTFQPQIRQNIQTTVVGQNGATNNETMNNNNREQILTNLLQVELREAATGYLTRTHYKTTMLSSKNQDDMKQSINRLDFSSIINTEKSMWTGSFSPVWLQQGMHWPPNLNKNKQQPIIDNESTNSYSIE
ncbi:unnamed protein product [Rotaria sordida]|uniref:Uncharacterized protein n=1 Tax=Rotaria sordida TaxID=392033 RepID=A0A816FFS2_9BILA|nr:unnamed protein product [Rotaria sordida]CAF1660997.1 unnamed protein product [Rotaria sordida]